MAILICNKMAGMLYPVREMKCTLRTHQLALTCSWEANLIAQHSVSINVPNYKDGAKAHRPRSVDPCTSIHLHKT